jgi:hypothetical protein
MRRLLQDDALRLRLRAHREQHLAAFDPDAVLARYEQALQAAAQ